MNCGFVQGWRQSGDDRKENIVARAPSAPGEPAHAIVVVLERPPAVCIDNGRIAAMRLGDQPPNHPFVAVNLIWRAEYGLVDTMLTGPADGSSTCSADE